MNTDSDNGIGLGGAVSQAVGTMIGVSLVIELIYRGVSGRGFIRRELSRLRREPKLLDELLHHRIHGKQE